MADPEPAVSVRRRGAYRHRVRAALGIGVRRAAGAQAPSARAVGRGRNARVGEAAPGRVPAVPLAHPTTSVDDRTTLLDSGYTIYRVRPAVPASEGGQWLGDGEPTLRPRPAAASVAWTLERRRSFYRRVPTLVGHGARLAADVHVTWVRERASADETFYAVSGDRKAIIAAADGSRVRAEVKCRHLPSAGVIALSIDELTPLEHALATRGGGTTSEAMVEVFFAAVRCSSAQVQARSSDEGLESEPWLRLEGHSCARVIEALKEAA